MKTIILMRHAEAEPEHAGGADFDRPLTTAGLHMAAAAAELLKQAGTSVDRILTSSALRTLQTSAAMAAVCPDAPCLALDSLYLCPGAAYADAVRQHAAPDDQVVLVVGHNPGIAQLMTDWAGLTFSVSPATVAVFQADTDEWRQIQPHPVVALQLTQLLQNGQHGDRRRD